MRELVCDNFAGGGGASTGIRLAIGRDPDIAINHNAEALSMHMANHPDTRHYCEDVWDVDPRVACKGQPVGLVWFSPDCKHFSKAKGGKPVSKKVRGLAWLAVKWAKLVRPRIICLENVEEFQTWGPLTEENMPCPKRKGETFRTFVGVLQRLGYAVEWRELKACDYGAPTTRKRLFLIARCDGQPIVWPERTHGFGKLPYRTAAECIDWSLPCPSIFTRTRPLAENTLRRIARGIQKYVIDCADPFIVGLAHGEHKERAGLRAHAITEPVRTIHAGGGNYALVVPGLISTRNGEREGQEPRTRPVTQPFTTVTAQGSQGALIAAFLAKQNGVGEKMVIGQPLIEPCHTITATDQKALVTSSIIKLQQNSIGQDMREPLHTVMAGAARFAEVRAFLLKFYSEGGQWQSLRDPMHTIPTKDRLALVTVAGEDYAIVDIGLRMLTPRELFKAQGFPADYIIGDNPYQNLVLSKTAQVRMVGNSVSPPLAEALVRANYTERSTTLRRVA
jgi:DNA (cytosine-5)-methyltransferase 1